MMVEKKRSVGEWRSLRSDVMPFFPASWSKVANRSSCSYRIFGRRFCCVDVGLLAVNKRLTFQDFAEDCLVILSRRFWHRNRICDCDAILLVLRDGKRLGFHVLRHDAAQIVVELPQFRSVFAKCLNDAFCVERAFFPVCVKSFKIHVFFAHGVAFEKYAHDLYFVVAVFAPDIPIDERNLALAGRQVIDIDRRVFGEIVQPICGGGDSDGGEYEGSKGHNKTRITQSMLETLSAKSKYLVKQIQSACVVASNAQVAVATEWPSDLQNHINRLGHAFEKARELREVVG